MISSDPDERASAMNRVGECPVVVPYRVERYLSAHRDLPRLGLFGLWQKQGHNTLGIIQQLVTFCIPILG